MLMLPFIALAQAVPDVEPIAQLLSLSSGWNSMSPIAIGSVLVVLAMSIIKKFVGEDMKWKRLVVALLSSAYAVLLSLTMGLGVLPAIVAALVTGGGAMAIYEAYKGLKKVATGE